MRSSIFVSELAESWGEVNVVHSFREGNTRAQFVFYSQLSHQAGLRTGTRAVRAWALRCATSSSRRGSTARTPAVCEERGITDPGPVRHAAASILAVMDGLQVQWLHDPSAVDFAESTRFAIEAIVTATLHPAASDLAE